MFTHCVFVLMILKISSCCCFLDIDDIEKHMPGLLKVIVILNDYIDNALVMKVMEIMCFTGFY